MLLPVNGMIGVPLLGRIPPGLYRRMVGGLPVILGLSLGLAAL